MSPFFAKVCDDISPPYWVQKIFSSIRTELLSYVRVTWNVDLAFRLNIGRSVARMCCSPSCLFYRVRCFLTPFEFHIAALRFLKLWCAFVKNHFLRVAALLVYDAEGYGGQK